MGGRFKTRARGGAAMRAATVAGAIILAPTGNAILASAASAQEAANTINYSVPAGPLSSALMAFGQQSGLQVTFLSTVTAGKTSPGFSGSASRSQALSAILQGTGLSYSFPNATTVAVSSALENSGATVEGAIALDTIDVSGGGGAQAAADEPYRTPGTSAYVSQQTLQQVPVTTPGDMFRSVPGVSVIGNRSGVSMDINIRGMQGMNRIATTIDGAMQQTSLYKGYSGHGTRFFVDPELLAGVSVEKGPGSAPGAMGGSVDMRTLSAGDIVKPGNKFGVRLRGSVGSNSIERDTSWRPAAGSNFSNPRPPGVGLIGGADDALGFGNAFASAVAAYASDTVEVIAGSSARRTGNYFAGTHGADNIPGSTNWRYRFSQYQYGEQVYNTSQKTQSSFAKALVRPSAGHAFEAGYIHYDSLYGEGYRDSLSTALSKSEVALSEVRTDTYTLRYKWDPSDNPLINLQANLWASDVYNFFSGMLLVTDAFSWGGDIKNTSEFDGPLGNLIATYGAQFFKDETESFNDYSSFGMFPTPWGGQREMHSAFANVQYLVARLIQFDAGIRYDRYRVSNEVVGLTPVDIEQSKTNPTAGITLLPFDGVQLFAKFAKGWRPPAVQEISVNVGAGINDMLRPETSTNWEYGFNVARDGVLTEDDAFRFKAAYFDNTYEDYIARTINFNLGGYQFGNISGMKMKGVEVSGSYDIGWAFGHASYNYYTDVQYCPSSCTTITSGVDYGSMHIPPKYTASFAGGVRLLDRKLVVGGRATLVGKRAIGMEGTTPSAAYGSPWAPYKIFDVFGSYEFNDNTELHFSAENVTDRYFIDAMSDDRMPGPGRTLRSTMTLKF